MATATPKLPPGVLGCDLCDVTVHVARVAQPTHAVLALQNVDRIAPVAELKARVVEAIEEGAGAKALTLWLGNIELCEGTLATHGVGEGGRAAVLTAHVRVTDTSAADITGSCGAATGPALSGGLDLVGVGGGVVGGGGGGVVVVGVGGVGGVGGGVGVVVGGGGDDVANVGGVGGGGGDDVANVGGSGSHSAVRTTH